ncbi:AraC family transcriptional regulator [Halomonas sp. ISL-60]|uniref:AraC family transcriptional regulator n=1 Tax=Halomonas sp. ISL-56 TaxID=2819149 RepID=UPI001BE8F176|nr:AraC family transcriptional regulator [Halomonas sp. ISL-56]MBT2771052.1 AraC family transcriptional regulator [Halomonas sp. ISL-60]MBT2801945.1 AraC family transcriptional regulator [Halomonas sp. ISL-56]
MLNSFFNTQIERFEAFFSGVAFEPHRHDTYAVGRTLAGVHCFNYRGEKRTSLPGNTIVIHPDELHDGEAGTNEGFHYRIMYIEPRVLQTVLGGRPLPYIKDGISTDSRLYAATEFLMNDLEAAHEKLEEEDILFELANVLSAVAGHKIGRVAYDYSAAEKAREYIHYSLDSQITLDDLALVSGREKWSLSRDFRALYGTSPYRYLTMRRLSFVKHYLTLGYSLSYASVSAGFNDQSHMTNHFKKAFGLTPTQWLSRFMKNYRGIGY